MNVHFTSPRLSRDGFGSSNAGQGDYPPLPVAPAQEKLALVRSRAQEPRASTPWPLLALGVGYLLLVAGPLWSSRFSAASFLQDRGMGGAWLPAPAAAGLALLGAAALIFVIARLVRDVEQRPYASIAPVLAVFSGFILTSTRAELGLPGIGSSQLGLLALALALLGGVLIGRDGFSERALGWVLAIVPTLALVLMVSALHGERNPVKMFQRIDAALGTYFSLLIVSCLAMAAVGIVSRRLLRSSLLAREGATRDGRSRGASATQDAPYAQPVISMPRVEHHSEPLAQRAARAVAQHVAHHERTHMLAGAQPWQPQTQHNARIHAGPGYAAGQAGRGHSVRRVAPRSYPASSPAPVILDSRAEPPRASTGELALDDPDLLKLTGRKFPLLRIALLAAVGVGVGLATMPFFPLSTSLPGQAAPHARDRAEAVRAPTTELNGTTDKAADQVQLRTSREPALGAASTSTPSSRAGAAPAPVVALPGGKPSAETSLRPVVTPLSPSTTEPAATEPAATEPQQPSLRSHPRREHHSSAVRSGTARAERHHATASEAKPVDERASEDELAEPASKASRSRSRVSPEKKVVSEPELEASPSKPVAAPKAAAAPAKSQGSDELDLDELVQKALQGGHGNASDDPILGL
jgi:hypothetical protein